VTFDDARSTATGVPLTVREGQIAPSGGDAAGLPVNQADPGWMPFEYMDCDSLVFLPGDRVVVEFRGPGWSDPVIIGFESHPRWCPTPRITWMCDTDTSGYPEVPSSLAVYFPYGPSFGGPRRMVARVPWPNPRRETRHHLWTNTLEADSIEPWLYWVYLPEGVCTAGLLMAEDMAHGTRAYYDANEQLWEERFAAHQKISVTSCGRGPLTPEHIEPNKVEDITIELSGGPGDPVVIGCCGAVPPGGNPPPLEYIITDGPFKWLYRQNPELFYSESTGGFAYTFELVGLVSSDYPDSYDQDAYTVPDNVPVMVPESNLPTNEDFNPESWVDAIMNPVPFSGGPDPDP
jgi:hypothetical protein